MLKAAPGLSIAKDAAGEFTANVPDHIMATRDPVCFGTVDAALNYQVTPALQLTLEGLNLNKEHIRQYGRDTTNLYFAQELDTRYQLGVRYKF